jgi:hypothetical protein
MRGKLTEAEAERQRRVIYLFVSAMIRKTGNN